MLRLCGIDVYRHLGRDCNYSISQ
uniref:Uncharacterized protein n=1 Tax=Anguilla anguilla TaxID=7936 RepID=A0A0E9R514_ANGAN